AAGILAYWGSTFDLSNVIVAYSQQGAAVACDSLSSIDVSCSDIYGNQGGDWTGCLAGLDSINNNLWTDPVFCDTAAGNYQLNSESPCAIACSTLIGAFGVGCEPTDVEGDEDDPEPLLPSVFTLHQNYPNPFNAGTVISYELPARSTVRLDVLNVLGQLVVRLIDESQPAGAHRVSWEGTAQSGGDVASGVYFYRLTTGDTLATRKMMLVK
ncbi:T9SS type A sorting domain-containing protein, partial [candidate division GN15 bacterium]|nr:T9SS type A sorting domain-containing protein [candidate division GN15 bacterium]